MAGQPASSPCHRRCEPFTREVGSQRVMIPAPGQPAAIRHGSPQPAANDQRAHLRSALTALPRDQLARCNMHPQTGRLHGGSDNYQQTIIRLIRSQPRMRCAEGQRLSAVRPVLERLERPSRRKPIPRMVGGGQESGCPRAGTYRCAAPPRALPPFFGLGARPGAQNRGRSPPRSRPPLSDVCQGGVGPGSGA